MSNYLNNVLTAPVSQRERLSDNQVKNSAGGYVYAADNWTRLNRFLILGSEGNTYYSTERELTLENIGVVKECIKEDGLRTVAVITEISDAGRAPKNDPALMALAACAALGDTPVRQAAFAALPAVARIPTHLFHFMTYLKALDGFSGRAFRTGIARWYNTKSNESIANLVTKYRQRDGWTNGNVIRLGHVPPRTLTKNEDGQYFGSHDRVREDIYRWTVNGGWDEIGDGIPEDKALQTIWAFEKVQRAKNEKEVISLIRDFGLTRETIPTQFLNSKEVWSELLTSGRGMPLEAMVRNLGVMSSNGLLVPLSQAVQYVVGRLDDEEAIVRARLHPIKVLMALLTYQSGRGLRGSNHWTPVTQVTDALDAAFYKAFKAVEPTNKRHVLALDVSGSMGMGIIAGMQGLTPRVASAAMALVTAAIEPQTVFVAFTSANHSKYVSKNQTHRFSMGEGITVLDISPKMRLGDVVSKLSALPMGGTDCALPYLWAQDNGIEADAFITYTDSETWAGDIQPTVAIDGYRSMSGIADAKGIVVGMISNGFSIANPNDTNMMDVVGFDTNAPALMAEFVRGNL